jgi:glycosyltransferase involved in cell wall biosynthesis
MSSLDENNWVAYIEPLWTGHHPVYAAAIVRALVAKGYKVRFYTTCGSFESARVNLAALHTSIEWILIDSVEQPKTYGPIDLLAHQLRWWRVFRRVAINKVLFALLAFYEYIDKVFPILGSPWPGVPLAAVCISARFHHKQMGILNSTTRSDRLYKWLFERWLKSKEVFVLFTNDDTLSEFASQQLQPYWRKVCSYPDTADVGFSYVSDQWTLQADKVFGDRKILLLYGYIDQRKGVIEACAPFVSGQVSADWVLVIAGSQSEQVRGMLGERRYRAVIDVNGIVVFDERLSGNRTNYLFERADAVWLGYMGFSTMSGVLLQAACRRKPVIASKIGVVGSLTEKHSLGITIDPADSNALIRILNQPDLLLQQRLSPADAASFERRHSLGSVGTSIVSHCLQALVAFRVDRYG